MYKIIDGDGQIFTQMVYGEETVFEKMIIENAEAILGKMVFTSI